MPTPIRTKEWPGRNRTGFMYDDLRITSRDGALQLIDRGFCCPNCWQVNNPLADHKMRRCANEECGVLLVRGGDWVTPLPPNTIPSLFRDFELKKTMRLAGRILSFAGSLAALYFGLFLAALGALALLHPAGVMGIIGGCTLLGMAVTVLTLCAALFAIGIGKGPVVVSRQ